MKSFHADMTQLSRTDELAEILKKGITPVLEPAGFERVRQGLTWMRPRQGIFHLVNVSPRRGICDVFWGLVDPGSILPLYGVAARNDDFSLSVVQGTAATISHSARASWFDLEDPDRPSVDDLSANLQHDMRIILPYLARFETRRDIRSYLLENRDEKDPRTEFIVPPSLGLKLLTAAALALADEDPAACDLIGEADARFLARGQRDPRVSRLRELAGPLCGDDT
jgi:hypothetical protein